MANLQRWIQSISEQAKGTLVDFGDGTYGELHAVAGKLVTVSTEFTRPNNTDGYIAGDVVSNSTSASTLIELANAVRSAGGSGYIVAIRLSTDKKSITPRFRVHFFNASNPTVAVDNAQWKEVYADASKRLGYVDLNSMTTGADTTNSDMSRAQDLTVRVPFNAANSATSIYALLEALDGFTPAANEEFTLTITVDQN